MRLQVGINFNVDTDTELSVSTYPESNNVANNSQITSGRYMGYKGFQLSSSDRSRVISTLDGAYAMYPEEGYRGILTRAISDAEGTVEAQPTIVLRYYTYSADKFYIIFDRKCKEYATEITLIVDDVGTWSMSNDKVMMSVDLSKYMTVESNKTYVVRVRINSWSAPNASVKITYIGCGYSEIFSDNMLKEVTCSENSLNSQLHIQPGIIEQFANISIYDRYGGLHFAAREMLLQQSADVEISAIQDDDDDTVVTLGTYVASTWDIRGENNVVKVDCTDPTVNFDKIYIDNLPVKDRSLHDMLSELFSYVKEYPWTYQDNDTRDYCMNIITPNNWFASGSLADLLQKVCTLGILCIYWSNKMFIVMRGL